MVNLDTSPAVLELERGYRAPFCRVEGESTSSCFHPDGYSLWLVTARLAPGTVVSWDEQHGDEAVYLLDGAVTVQGTTCPSGGAVIVEAGVPGELRAEAETRVLHMGPTDPLPPRDGLFGAAASAGRSIHVIAPAEGRVVGTVSDNVTNLNFGDSTCPTCRITMFLAVGLHGVTGVSHVHTQDEIIHVLAGEMHVGTQVVGPGTSIAIPGGRRYRFRTYGPYTFLNYRRDVSSMTVAPGTEPWLETVESMERFIANRRPHGLD
jgi:quercetin dioxygenase-like cupin family protein